MTERLTYNFTLAFDRGAFFPLYAYLDYGLVPGRLHLMVGQFDRPFGRLPSPAEILFADFSLVDQLAPGPDLGLVLHSGFALGGFQYSLGLTNGTGISPNFTGQFEVDPDTGLGAVVDGASLRKKSRGRRSPAG